MIHVPVHTHSEYSALDGLATMDEIADRCIELGYTAVGNSDHGTVAGHLEFSKVMRARDIKPIFACELYHGINPNVKGAQRDQAHFLAGALTDQGLRTLWRLVDASASNHHHRPRINWDMLERYNEGLFATSACMSGLVAQGVINDDLSALNRYLEIFGDDFYIELHTYPGEDHELLNHQLVQIAEEKGIKTMVATDAHYASPDQYELHDAYVAHSVRESVYLDPADRKMWHPRSLYIQSVDEIRQSLDYLPTDVIDEALRNGIDLAARVEADLPEVKRHLPTFVPADCPWLNERDTQKSAGHLFIDLVETGLYSRYGKEPSQEVWERAEKEMEVFLEGGLEHYFLQAWDFCQFCDEKGIRRGPGRGSAGGAIVAYALGITDVDPLYYDLMFERFYNPGREKGFPDIDNDFPTAKRKLIREYVAQRWGENKVRSIGSTSRLKPKKACDETYHALEITYAEKEELKKIISGIPDIDIHGPETIGWDSQVDPGKTIYVMDHVGEDIIKWIEKAPNDRQNYLLKWVDILRHVCSRVSGYGVHASGTVISDVDLADELPCQWSTGQKIPVTAFTMDDVDARQFVKQDFLGLRNLDSIEEWEKLKGEVEWSGLELKDHPEEMWELLDRGLGLGIFQIEDGYGRQLCKEIKPRSIDDLGAIVAMNRPGPIRAKVPDSYIARKFGHEEVTYDHPLLEEILEPTYGLFIYQEQVITFMKTIGYTPSDADAVRKILGKKRPEAMRDLGKGKGEWADKGYYKMAMSAGISELDAQTIWEKLEGFASYSFNKSHAIQYAVLAFRTLYAKYYGPAEFVIALLRTNPKNAGAYVLEGRRMGVTVKAPRIDHSEIDTAVIDNEIYFGFSNILNVGKETAQFVCKLRKDGHDLSSPEKLFNVIEEEQAQWEAKGKKGRSPRQKFRGQYQSMTDAGCWDDYEDRSISTLQRQNLEKDLLQVILTDDSPEILERNSEKIEASCHDWSELEGNAARFTLPGVVMKVDEKRTKKDRKAMGLVTIEYEGQDVEFVVFSKLWKQYKFLWRERATGIFDLKRADRGISFESGRKLT